MLAHVIAWWLMECPPWVWMADVIAKVADEIATWVSVLVLILLFCVGPHPIYEADGICLCFCLGMGH